MPGSRKRIRLDAAGDGTHPGVDVHGDGTRNRSWPGPGCDRLAPEALLLVPWPAILAIAHLAGRDSLCNVHPEPGLSGPLVG
jgi:hypothetical protein